MPPPTLLSLLLTLTATSTLAQQANQRTASWDTASQNTIQGMSTAGPAWQPPSYFGGVPGAGGGSGQTGSASAPAVALLPSGAPPPPPPGGGVGLSGGGGSRTNGGGSLTG